jgi:hypothetical protein
VPAVKNTDAIDVDKTSSTLPIWYSLYNVGLGLDEICHKLINPSNTLLFTSNTLLL